MHAISIFASSHSSNTGTKRSASLELARAAGTGCGRWIQSISAPRRAHDEMHGILPSCSSIMISALRRRWWRQKEGKMSFTQRPAVVMEDVCRSPVSRKRNGGKACVLRACSGPTPVRSCQALRPEFTPAHSGPEWQLRSGAMCAWKTPAPVVGRAVGLRLRSRPTYSGRPTLLSGRPQEDVPES